MVGASNASSFVKAQARANKNETPELIVTGWSCFCTFALVVVMGSVTFMFAIARYGGMRDPTWNEATAIRTASPMASTRVGFFIEIGHPSINVEASTRGKHLEKKGWHGVCASPFPGEYSGRTCKVIALAVSGTSGDKTLARDCTKDKIRDLLSNFAAEADPCPLVETNTLGIKDLLSISTPPPVIDYVSLETHGKESDILSNFPFQEYCVRAWAINHDDDKIAMANVRQILEVAQGCRLSDSRGEIWARCPCDKSSKHREPATKTETTDARDSIVRRQAQKLMILDPSGHASESA